jgi:hypothetical protein
VPGPVMPSVVVGAAEATAEELVGAGRIGDTTEETTDTTLDKSESIIGAVEVGAAAEAVVAAESVAMGVELVAAAVDAAESVAMGVELVAAAVDAAESVAMGVELVATAVEAVITPLGPNVMAVSEVVVAAPEVSLVLGVVVAGG